MTSGRPAVALTALIVEIWFVGKELAPNSATSPKHHYSQKSSKLAAEVGSENILHVVLKPSN
jgi:hypothetical protein